MENTKTAKATFEDAKIRFTEKTIEIVWTGNCTKNPKMEMIENWSDIDKIRYCVFKNAEYDFIQVKRHTDGIVCSIEEAMLNDTCVIVKKDEDNVVNNMLEYIKNTYEDSDEASKNEKIVELMKQYEKKLYKKSPNCNFFYGNDLPKKFKLIKKEFGTLISLDEVIALFGNSVTADTVFTENGFYTKIGGFTPKFFAFSDILKITIENCLGPSVFVYLDGIPEERVLLCDAKMFGFVGEQWKNFLCDMQKICLKKYRKDKLIEYVEVGSEVVDETSSNTSPSEDQVAQFEGCIEHFPIRIGTVSVKEKECGQYRIRIDHKSGRSFIFETTSNEIVTLIARGAGKYNYKEFENE